MGDVSERLLEVMPTSTERRSWSQYAANSERCFDSGRFERQRGRGTDGLDGQLVRLELDPDDLIVDTDAFSMSVDSLR